MIEEQITDLSTLREMSMGDDAIIIETVEAFLEDVPDSLEEIKQLQSGKNYENLSNLAHRIKPNIGYMGMDYGQDLIIAIEKLAKSEDPDGQLKEKVAQFDTHCNKAFDELAQKVEKLKA